MTPNDAVPFAPDGMQTDEFLLRRIRASDAEADYEAVMETKESLRKWEQTGWPDDGFTVEANREDLIRLEERHDRGESFTYTVADPVTSSCLGCLYVFPTGASLFARAEVTTLGDDLWSQHEVAVYFWVRASRLVDRLDERLVAASDRWLEREWRLQRPLFVTNEDVAQQVTMLEATGRTRRFELSYPNKPAKEWAYAWPGR
ncbi:MAG: N-acetyltransferase [Candidatus Eisenbacteria bacterium]|nr:N-acetyltransferase [Candidatus Eisenbacteria bacterium]